MNLREHTLYLRASTWRDVFDDGSVATRVSEMETLTGLSFSASQDLGSSRRQRPGRPRPGLVALEDYMGRGLNIFTKVRLFSGDPEEPKRQQVLTVRAGSHPYTGRFRTSFDLRIPLQRFEDAAFVERFVTYVETFSRAVRPFTLHAHDTDDTLMQNMASPTILKHGFGVEEAPEDTPGDNPGLEISRGEFRYLASWLMGIGGDFLNELGPDRVDAAPARIKALGDDFRLLRLYDSPLEATTATARDAQRATRAALRFDEITGEKGWAFGYWDRKKRQPGRTIF